MAHDSDRTVDLVTERLAEAEAELASMLDLEVSLGVALEARDAARAERDLARADRDDVRRALDSARADAEVVRAEIHARRAEVAALRAEVDDLRSSTSWRVTAPLRWLSARRRGGSHA